MSDVNIGILEYNDLIKNAAPMLAHPDRMQ